MADGSIRIDTIIETKAAKAELKRLEKVLAETESKQEKLNNSDRMAMLRNEMEIERQRYQQALKNAGTQQQRNNIEREHNALVEAIGVKYSDVVDKANQYSGTLNETKQRIESLKGTLERTTEETHESETHASRLKSFFGSAKNAAIGIARSIGGRVLNGLKKSLSYVKNIKRHTDGLYKKILRTGLALIGMRGIMAGLRQIVSSALNNNEKLQSQLTAIKGVLGQALAPVIQIITDAIGQIVTFVDKLYSMLTGTSLIAKYNASQAKKIADATSDAADSAKEYKNQMAGFDVANKLEDNSSSSSKKSSDNSANMFETQKLSNWAQNLLNKIKSSWKTGDFTDVGSMISGKIVGALQRINWNSIESKTFGAGKSFATFINGLLRYKDKDGNSLTKSLSQSISGAIKSALSLAIGFLENLDWRQLAKSVEDFFAGIDFSGIADRLFEAIGAAIGGISAFLLQLLSDAWKSIHDYFSSYIEEAGGNIAVGLFNGIIDGFKNMGLWIKAHIFDPFMKGFKEAFGIASPSKEMEKMGGYLIDGLKNGLSGIWNKVHEKLIYLWQKLVAWFKPSGFSSLGSNLKTGIFDGIGNLWSKLKSRFSTFWENIKAWFKVSGFTSLGSNIVEGIKNGIRDNFYTVIATVTDKIKNLTSTVKDLLGIASPSKVFKEEVGKMIPFGLGEGISKYSDYAIDTADDVTRRLTQQFKTDLSKVPALSLNGIVNRPGGNTNIGIASNGLETALSFINSALSKLSGANNGGGQIIVPVYLDGRQIANYTIDTMNRQAFELNRGGAY